MGLPRGGIGLIGSFLSSLTALFVSATWSDAVFAVWFAVFCMLPTVWFAIGLRRDDDAGEMTDRYIATGRGIRILDFLSEQFESERRWSTDMIFVTVLAVVVGLIRCRSL
jgi:hypothetical protein